MLSFDLVWLLTTWHSANISYLMRLSSVRCARISYMQIFIFCRCLQIKPVLICVGTNSEQFQIIYCLWICCCMAARLYFVTFKHFKVSCLRAQACTRLKLTFFWSTRKFLPNASPAITIELCYSAYQTSSWLWLCFFKSSFYYVNHHILAQETNCHKNMLLSS